jgi:hypothetical protein
MSTLASREGRHRVRLPYRVYGLRARNQRGTEEPIAAISSSQRCNTEVRLTLCWREKDPNPRSLHEKGLVAPFDRLGKTDDNFAR